jgi:hypothetical protein
MDSLQHAAETKSSNGSNRSKRSSRPRLTSEIFLSSLQITDNLTALQPEANSTEAAKFDRLQRIGYRMQPFHGILREAITVQTVQIVQAVQNVSN